jgi:hypothetical protein
MKQVLVPVLVLGRTPAGVCFLVSVLRLDLILVVIIFPSKFRIASPRTRTSQKVKTRQHKSQAMLGRSQFLGAKTDG